MIELTQLNGERFVLNCDLIETIKKIPETKITLSDGKYYLVLEEETEIIDRIIEYKKEIFGRYI